MSFQIEACITASNNSFGRFVAFPRMPKRFREPFHLSAVDAGDIQVHVQNVPQSAGEAGDLQRIHG